MSQANNNTIDDRILSRGRENDEDNSEELDKENEIEEDSDEENENEEKEDDSEEEKMAEEEGGGQRSLRERVSAARQAMNIKKKVKEKIVKKIVAPAKIGTNWLLRSAWINLIPSWGLTLIWIN